jgi:hypothetical protein
VQRTELLRLCLILASTVESDVELGQISRAAVALGRIASVSVRVNPDVNAVTHPYISTGLREHKFGIDIHAVEDLYRRAASLPGILPEGVSSAWKSWPFHKRYQLNKLYRKLFLWQPDGVTPLYVYDRSLVVNVEPATNVQTQRVIPLPVVIMPRSK